RPVNPGGAHPTTPLEGYVLVERKVAKGSIAAGLVAGLVALATFLGKKVGIDIDPAVATPVATAVVVWVVTFVVGYVTKHTNRPDLADDVEEALGLDETEPTDAYEPRHLAVEPSVEYTDESDAPDVARDAGWHLLV